eukprot:CAMPEP_0185729546 /NCGR_PEP_ID=MMETSP1171-20130828/6316_1 /TAXON_ID=374046 /ORGANISM="Helicotheca tamensis, Strain CCMP826" /LENGTH=169 /DNA_ID=CAMNT_0028398417 /DNA_START=38 /DNA_END=547 /DNA_ORIENTATION=-
MAKAATILGGSSAGFLTAFVAYDYRTCHPMRKIEPYNVGQALIRLHNIFASRSLLPQRNLSLSELAQYDGKDGKPTYFSADGAIYDVSSSEMFASTYELWAGRDASVALAKMSLDKRDINRTDWEKLSNEELESLQSWTEYFRQKYIIKGHLKEFLEKDSSSPSPKAER